MNYIKNIEGNTAKGAKYCESNKKTVRFRDFQQLLSCKRLRFDLKTLSREVVEYNKTKFSSNES